MQVASIKGIAFQFVWNGLDDLRREGKLDRAELEARLPAEDLELLDQEVVSGLWYPITSFRRLLAFALEKEGRPPSNWPQRGYEVAEILLANKTYKDFLAAAVQRGDRSGFTLTQLGTLLLNFSKWSFEEEPADGSMFHVVVDEAAELPDELIGLAEGFIAFLSLRVLGRPVEVSSERVGPDRVVFRAMDPPRS
jgi:hypothetical protein